MTKDSSEKSFLQRGAEKLLGTKDTTQAPVDPEQERLNAAQGARGNAVPGNAIPAEGTTSGGTTSGINYSQFDGTPSSGHIQGSSSSNPVITNTGTGAGGAGANQHYSQTSSGSRSHGHGTHDHSHGVTPGSATAGAGSTTDYAGGSRQYGQNSEAYTSSPTTAGQYTTGTHGSHTGTGQTVPAIVSGTGSSHVGTSGSHSAGHDHSHHHSSNHPGTEAAAAAGAASATYSGDKPNSGTYTQQTKGSYQGQGVDSTHTHSTGAYPQATSQYSQQPLDSTNYNSHHQTQGHHSGSHSGSHTAKNAGVGSAAGAEVGSTHHHNSGAVSNKTHGSGNGPAVSYPDSQGSYTRATPTSQNAIYADDGQYSSTAVKNKEYVTEPKGEYAKDGAYPPSTGHNSGHHQSTHPSHTHSKHNDQPSYGGSSVAPGTQVNEVPSLAQHNVTGIHSGAHSGSHSGTHSGTHGSSSGAQNSHTGNSAVAGGVGIAGAGATVAGLETHNGGKNVGRGVPIESSQSGFPSQQSSTQSQYQDPSAAGYQSGSGLGNQHHHHSTGATTTGAGVGSAAGATGSHSSAIPHTGHHSGTTATGYSGSGKQASVPEQGSFSQSGASQYPHGQSQSQYSQGTSHGSSGYSSSTAPTAAGTVGAGSHHGTHHNSHGHSQTQGHTSASAGHTSHTSTAGATGSSHGSYSTQKGSNNASTDPNSSSNIITIDGVKHVIDEYGNKIPIDNIDIKSISGSLPGNKLEQLAAAKKIESNLPSGVSSQAKKFL